jgi:hypothetical protein
MTFTIMPRRRPVTDPQGPLCQDWEQNLAGMPWDGCLHDSCWVIVTGGKR